MINHRRRIYKKKYNQKIFDNHHYLYLSYTYRAIHQKSVARTQRMMKIITEARINKASIRMFRFCSDFVLMIDNSKPNMKISHWLDTNNHRHKAGGVLKLLQHGRDVRIFKQPARTKNAL